MTGRWRAYFELLRLPAVFTAVADVMMGYLVTRGELHPTKTFLLLAAVSALMYSAGMVLNDVYDSDVDARERPHRPIPSGRISHRTAGALGGSLLILGVMIAYHIGTHTDHWRPAIVSLALSACIVFYDAFAKRTSAGPIVMGLCRTLNVLLGMSLAATAAAPNITRPWNGTEWMIATGIGVYIAGVTLFARREAGASSRRSLAAGTAIIVAGIGLIAAAPLWNVNATTLQLGLTKWFLLWVLLSTVIVRRCIIAWRIPLPEPVQQAIRTCLRSVIVIDAAIVLGFCGPYWGCAVLALLVPMLLLERWFDTT